MQRIHDDTIKVLYDLIEICTDSSHGFKLASADARDEEWRALFQAYSLERTEFARELQECIQGLGGDPDKRGSLSGSLHQGWVDLESAISSNEPHAVLSECERSEDSAVQAYRDALEKRLEPLARELISRQFAAVIAAHERVRQLRDSPAYLPK